MTEEHARTKYIEARQQYKDACRDMSSLTKLRSVLRNLSEMIDYRCFGTLTECADLAIFIFEAKLLLERRQCSHSYSPNEDLKVA